MTDKFIESALDHLSNAYPSYSDLAPKPTLYHIVRDLQDQRKHYLTQLILQALLNKQTNPAERDQCFTIDTYMTEFNSQGALADKLAERIFDREDSVIRDLVVYEQEKGGRASVFLCFNVDE